MKRTYLFVILTFLFVSLSNLSCGGKKNVKNNQNQQKNQNVGGDSDDTNHSSDDADDNSAVIPNQDGDINNTCDSDTLEPNDSFAEAKELKAGEYDLNLCAADQDWLRIPLNKNDVLNVTLTFSGSAEDYGVYLVASDGITILANAEQKDSEFRLKHTALESGTHHIFIENSSSTHTGNYHLLVAIEAVVSNCIDDVFEENDDALTTGSKPHTGSGTYKNLKLCDNDTDWFAIDLKANDILTAKAVFKHTPTSNLEMVLFDLDGKTQIEDSRTTENEEEIKFTAGNPGTYFLKLYEKNNKPAEYEINLKITAAPPPCTDDNFEDNDAAPSAKKLGQNNYTSLRVCYGDIDWYAFQVKIGEHLKVDIEFDHSKGNIDAVLYDSDQTTSLVSSTDLDDNEHLEYKNRSQVDAVYYLKIYGTTDVNNTYNIKAIIEAPPPACIDDQFDTLSSKNNDYLSASALTGPDQTIPSLALCSEDEDWYSVTLQDFDTVTFSITFTHSNGDLDLWMYDSTGTNQIKSSATSNNSVNQEYISYKIPLGGAGTYYFKVSSKNLAANSYSLNLSVQAFTPVCLEDSYDLNGESNESIGDATILSLPSGSFSKNGLKLCGGTTGSRDDYYKIDLSSGDTVNVTITYNHSTANDIDVELLDFSGAALAHSDANTGVEQISYKAQNSGAFYLRVYAYNPNFVENSYNFSLNVISLPACQNDDTSSNETYSNAMAITLTNGSYTKTGFQICSGDKDWYKFTIAENEQTVITVEFLVSLGDINASLYDSNGATLLVAGTSQTDNEIIKYLNPTASAKTVYLLVQGVSGVENHYDLIVANANPLTCTDDTYDMSPNDNDSALKAVQLASSANPYAGLKLCPGDEDWFKVEIGHNQQLDVLVNNFVDSSQNVDVKLIAPNGTTILKTSENTTGVDETITYINTNVIGIYYVVITGIQTTKTGYDLKLTITQPSCIEDVYEPNNTFENAWPITMPQGVSTFNLPNLKACTTIANDDFFKIDVPAYTHIKVDITFTMKCDPSNVTCKDPGDLDLYLYDSNKQLLSNPAVEGASSSDNETVNYKNFSNTLKTIYIKVDGYNQSTNTYTLDIALSCAEDDKEENDTHSSATILPDGIEKGPFVVCGADVDWFRLPEVAISDDIKVTVSFDHSKGDINAYLYLIGPGGSPSNPVASGESATNNEVLEVTNANQGFYYLKVITTSAYNGYTVTADIIPAVGCTDDSLEENDTKQTSTPVASYPYAKNALRICSYDDDWYTFNVVNSGTVFEANIYFKQNIQPNDGMGDLDLYLYNSNDVRIKCDGQSSGDNNYYNCGYSNTDNETIKVSHLNPGTYYLLIRGYSGKTNNYDIKITLTGGVLCTADSYELENGLDTGIGDSYANAKNIDSDVKANPQTIPTDLSICPSEKDWYSLTLLEGDIFTASINFTNSLGDLDMFLFPSQLSSPSTSRTKPPGNWLKGSYSSSSNTETIQYIVPSGQSGMYILLIEGWSTSSNTYEMIIDINQQAATCIPSGNNTKESALLVDVSKTTKVDRIINAKICSGETDWYTFSLNAGETVDLYMNFINASGDLDMYLYENNGTTYAEPNSPDYWEGAQYNTDTEHINYKSISGGTYKLKIQGDTNKKPENAYSIGMIVNQNVSWCTDDSSEQNDTASTASPVTTSVNFHSQMACFMDEDYYKFSLDAQESVTIYNSFLHNNGDINMYLYPGSATSFKDSESIASAITTTDDEKLEYPPLNTPLSSTKNYILKVKGYLGAENSYSIDFLFGCHDDTYDRDGSDNDIPATATNLIPLSPNPKLIQTLFGCTDDYDWYQIEAEGGKKVSVTLSFTTGPGKDFDLYLYAEDSLALTNEAWKINPEGNSLTGTQGFSSTNNESVTYIIPSNSAKKKYYIFVDPFTSTTPGNPSCCTTEFKNTYTMSVQIQ